MPSTSYYAGGRLLPRTAEGVDSVWRDATIDGLLAYFAFWIQTHNNKAAEMGGPVSSAAVTDLCPAAHRFPFNHRNAFMRPLAGASAAPLPGLWIWEESRERVKDGASLFYPSVVQRNLRLHWIFQEVQVPDGYAERSGLIGDIASSLAKACEDGRHPSYTPDGDATGTPVWRALNLRGIEWTRAQPGEFAPLPSGSAVAGGRPASEGTAQRFFPAVDMQLRVWEFVGNFEPVIPDDVLGDSTLIIEHGDSVGDTVEILERALIAPDDQL